MYRQRQDAGSPIPSPYSRGINLYLDGLCFFLERLVDLSSSRVSILDCAIHGFPFLYPGIAVLFVHFSCPHILSCGNSVIRPRETMREKMRGSAMEIFAPRDLGVLGRAWQSYHFPRPQLDQADSSKGGPWVLVGSALPKLQGRSTVRIAQRPDLR
ncbi:hypothetical protein VUR80DRAFT_857 [Thermomyces stellatus]